MLSSLAAYELLQIQRQQKSEEAASSSSTLNHPGWGGVDQKPPQGLVEEHAARSRGKNPPQEQSPSPKLQRMAAYRRAFKKASLRWHPDKFEGRFGSLLSRDELDDEGRGGVRTNHSRAPPVSEDTKTQQRQTTKSVSCDDDCGRRQVSDKEEGESTHADAIRRRVRIISQSINEAWSAVSSCGG